MIQVIERVFMILERMEPGNGVSLDALTQSTKLNKGTLCNILKTMVALGYLEKSGVGCYRISAKFVALAKPFLRNESIEELCGRFAVMLAERTQESAVVATLRKGKMHILAQAQHQRQVMINYSFYKDLSLYHSVSGRVLLAHMDAAALTRVAEAAGMPGEEWDGITTLKELRKSAASIREVGVSIMRNPAEEINAYAMPIIDSAGEICAAIGLTVPVFRMGEGNEDILLDVLRDISRKMSDEIAARHLSTGDFMGQPKDEFCLLHGL